ncbi:MAG: sarcosine oxidase subunit beta family protein [Gammaproteobacteria bacterium]
MNRYSLWALARNALNYHQNWQAAWRSPPPRAGYDFVIIGGGGHGLATAYYLAKEHKAASIAVVEKGWLGGGNTGRNTTIVRSNYLLPPSARLYDHAVSLWHNLSAELNFNVMFSPRGLLHLAHTISDMREIARRGHSNYVNGVDAEMLTPQQVREMVPFINLHGRYPVLGALLQRRGGIARHDAVAWGYARAADSLGVDIIQNCEVSGFDIRDNKIASVRTSRGDIKVGKRVGAVPSAHCGVIAAMAGFRLPVETVPLQAFVSEPLAPVLDCVIMSNTVHAYISQSDKGELVIGGGSDAFNSYAQRGSFDQIEHVAGPIVELYPIFSRVNILRQWAGIVDITPDRSPILSATPVSNLFMNCGWGTGGFKATPGSGHAFAATLAKGEANDLCAPFSLDRFITGDLVDEAAAAAVAH